MDWVDQAEASFSFDDFTARLKTAIRCAGWTWLPFCERAGVPSDQAQRAVEACKYGLRVNLVVIDKLAAALGRDSQWLLTGDGSESKFTQTVREQSHYMVEAYSKRAQIPDEDISRLHSYVEVMIQNLQSHTPQAAYRRGLPSTWTDVAWIYEQMLLMQG